MNNDKVVTNLRAILDLSLRFNQSPESTADERILAAALGIDTMPLREEVAAHFQKIEQAPEGER